MTDTDTVRVLDDAGRALLFTEARTAYAFEPTPVGDAELESIWELAKWAPTSGNSQPLRVVFVRTEAGKARLIPHLAEGNRAKSESAPAVAILARDTRFHEHLPTVLPVRPGAREQFEADEAGRERVSLTASFMQAAYFILAVRAHGLAAGPMTGFDADGLDREFFPDGRLTATVVVNIGHPVPPPFDRLPRLAHKDVIGWA